MSSARIAIPLAAAALVVSVFGSTPIGSAAARLVVPDNSVGSRQLKPQSVSGLKVKDHSLTAVDFKKGQLPAGAKGDTGETGPAGPAGPMGSTGMSKFEVISQNLSIPSGQELASEATCPAGKTAVAGGHYASWPLVVIASHPGGVSSTSWYGRAKNLGVSTINFAVYAVCAKVS